MLWDSKYEGSEKKIPVFVSKFGETVFNFLLVFFVLFFFVFPFITFLNKKFISDNLFSKCGRAEGTILQLIKYISL